MRTRAATVYPEIQVTDLLSLPVGKPFVGGSMTSVGEVGVPGNSGGLGGWTEEKLQKPESSGEGLK